MQIQFWFTLDLVDLHQMVLFCVLGIIWERKRIQLVLDRIKANTCKDDSPFHDFLLLTSMPILERIILRREGGNDIYSGGLIWHFSTKGQDGAHQEWPRKKIQSQVGQDTKWWCCSAQDLIICCKLGLDAYSLLFVANWALEAIQAILGYSSILVLFSLCI